MSIVKLKDLLKRENILVRVHAENRRSAIRIGGEILVQNGFVEEEYVESALEMVEEIGGYLVISPGLAVCYATSEHSVKTMGMSLITLERSVHFGNRYNDPVHTLICLASEDNISYLHNIKLVVDKIHDGSMDNVACAEEIEDIIKLLH